MATVAEAIDILREAAESEGLTLPQVLQLTRKRDEEVRFNNRATQVVSILPSLPAGKWDELQQLVFDTNTVEYSLELAVKSIASAFKASDQQEFWKGVLILILGLKTYFPHLFAEPE